MEIFKTWLVNKYIAHRGLWNKNLPENSLGAFENAIKHDYAIELDVHQILDGTIVVYHDSTLKRIAGTDGYVKKIASKDDLKNYKLSGTKFCIPTLKEVLALVDGKVPILIESKNLDPKTGDFENDLYNLLKDYKGEYAVQSFNPYVLKWFKDNAPEVLRGQLSCYFKNEKMNFAKKYFLKHMLLNKKVSCPNFISYNYKDLPNGIVKKYKQLPLIAWAVPSQQEYMDVAKHCDNIIFEGFEPRI